MRAYLGEQMKTRSTPPATYAEFRRWCVEVFQLPGVPDDYEIYSKYSVRQHQRFKQYYNANDPFEFQSTIHLQRRPDGLAFSIDILEDRGSCCTIF